MCISLRSYWSSDYDPDKSEVNMAFEGEPSVDCQCSGSRLSKKSFLLFGGQVHKKKKTLRLFFQLDCIENRGKVDRGNEDEFKKNRPYWKVKN